MEEAPTTPRRPDHVCRDVAVAIVGIAGIGTTLLSLGLATATVYQAVVMHNPTLGPTGDFSDPGIAGWIGLALGSAITGIILAAVLYRTRRRGEYGKIIIRSAVMALLVIIWIVAFLIVRAVGAS